MALSNYEIVFRTLYLSNNDKKSIDLELQKIPDFHCSAKQ